MHMKRIFAALLASIIAPLALATTLAPVQLLNPAGSTSGQAVVSNGATSAPTWQSIVDSVIAGSGVTVSGATGNVTISIPAGGVSPTQLATQAANTVLGNATASTASPTAITVTGCNGAAQALQWTNGSGFGCNSSIATSGANANITSLSGLTTALSVPQGGSGRTTLTTHGVLVGEGTAAIAQLAVGTTGQVLVGSTGADPAFGSSVGALTFTGAITPSSTAGIVGTTTNDNANAGSVGEYVSATNTTPIALTANVAVNITSISLTAGDWDVSGIVSVQGAGTAQINNVIGSSSQTSATQGGFGSVTQIIPGSSSSNANYTIPIVETRYSLASTTTVYLVVMVGFSPGTCSATGFIRARRIR